MSVEFSGKKACIAPEGVFIIGTYDDYDKLQPILFDIATRTYRLVGPVVGKAFHDGLKLK